MVTHVKDDVDIYRWHLLSSLSFCCSLVGLWIDFKRTVRMVAQPFICIHLQSKGPKTSVSSQPCDATITCCLHSCERLWWCTARVGVTSTIGRASAWWICPLDPVGNSTSLLGTVSPEDVYVNFIWHMNSMKALVLKRLFGCIKKVNEVASACSWVG